MRELRARDLGPFSKIVAKMGIKEAIDEMTVSIDATGKTKEEVEVEISQMNEQLGAALVFFVVENYWRAEEEVNQLLASLMDKDLEEVKDLPLDEFVNVVKQIKDDPSFESFLKLVSN